MAPKTTNRRKPAAAKPDKKKRNPLRSGSVDDIHFTNTAMLRTFISDRGKIRSRRITGLTPQQQRRVATAIKNAREMALLPYHN